MKKEKQITIELNPGKYLFESVILLKRHILHH